MNLRLVVVLLFAFCQTWVVMAQTKAPVDPPVTGGAVVDCQGYWNKTCNNPCGKGFYDIIWLQTQHEVNGGKNCSQPNGTPMTTEIECTGTQCTFTPEQSKKMLLDDPDTKKVEGTLLFSPMTKNKFDEVTVPLEEAITNYLMDRMQGVRTGSILASISWSRDSGNGVYVLYAVLFSPVVDLSNVLNMLGDKTSLALAMATAWNMYGAVDKFSMLQPSQITLPDIPRQQALHPGPVVKLPAKDEGIPVVFVVVASSVIFLLSMFFCFVFAVRSLSI